MVLRDRRVVVAVSGSVAAYKLAQVVRDLAREGAEVRVAMTPSATRFVGPATFAALSGHPVALDLFESPERVMHVELGRWAEVLLLGATTASTIERLASGSGSDVVSATYLMCRAPVILAPAMHSEMWEHLAVRRNVRRLVEDGVTLVAPEVGPLASGDYGVGRLAAPARIIEAVCAALVGKDLEGVRVLITSGPTQEPIDPVRYISNRSTGRMGFALATEAVRRGAEVTIVTGPTPLPAPDGCEVVTVTTAQQMLDECLARFDATDLALMAAAVADWRPKSAADQKLKKADASSVLELETTIDIAAELGRKKGSQVLVAFAAETTDVLEHARAKLVSKNADFIVANLVGAPGTGFESDTNDAALIDSGSTQELPRMEKIELACRILDRAGGLIRAKR